jgi:lambda family phage minor tail protein L
MTNTAIQDVQKQDIGSATVELWELVLSDSSSAYFYSGLEADLTSLQFRDRTSPGTIRTYTALPIEGSGVNLQTAGASARPTLRVANVLSTFGDALGGLTNEDLIGKKVYRRTTLYKYCYGQAGDANPPVEFPQKMWYIDRIAEKTPLEVSFELASPFDLAGVKLPRRNVVANACAWKYQGSSPELSLASKVGGCNWNTYSRGTDTDGTIRTTYFNKKDEEVVSSTLTFNTNVSSITLGFYYKVAKTGLTQISTNGTLDPGESAFDYWQATVTTSNPGTPSDTNSNFRRVRVFTTYAASTSYKAYTDSNYNEYVTYDRGSDDAHVRLWQIKGTSNTANAHKSTPNFGNHWQLGDQCSKTVTGCAIRYKASYASIDGSVRRTINQNDNTLPFGGFPGTKTRS